MGWGKILNYSPIIIYMLDWLVIMLCFIIFLTKTYPIMRCMIKHTIITNQSSILKLMGRYLLRFTKSRIHSFLQFNKLITNCTKRVPKTVLIWGTLEIGSMKYSMNSGVFEHPCCINLRDLSHRNHKYISYNCRTVDVLT